MLHHILPRALRGTRTPTWGTSCPSSARARRPDAFTACAALGVALTVIGSLSACASAPSARETLSRLAADADAGHLEPGASSMGAPGPAAAAGERNGSTSPTGPLGAPAAADALALGKAALDGARRRALDLVQRAEAAPEDRGLNGQAAQALCDVADLSIHVALVARFRAEPPTSVTALVRGEDDLDGGLKRELEGLVRDAARLARAALDAPGTPTEAEVAALRQDEAFAETLAAWAMGPTRAVLSGAGRRLPKLLAANRALGSAREDASPLRLEGRFLSLAPWPVGDSAGGRALLEEATALAPVPMNALFLGDAAWLTDDPAAARAAWERARTAELKGPVDALVQELATLRLAAAEPGE
ncbi:MAG: hypothetical protein R3F49_08265 [Planctomycetota bacterium]